MSRRKIIVELTVLEAEQARQALDNFLGAADWDESIDFFGSATAALAAQRAHNALTAVLNDRSRP